MCGIVGFITREQGSQRSLEGVCTDMATRLRHRGPDDSGDWSDAAQGVYLGHRRLAIQDLSEHGHQPMNSPSGRYVIVFNGEIYNFLDLRKQMAGVAFNGHSDTEVLMALIDKFGIDEALKRSTGMFALAVFDRESQVLTLARDRMGEKPLYYGWIGKRFVFASELTAFGALPDWNKKDLSEKALHLFLRHGYVPCPHSIYRDIYKLPPGTSLAVPVGEAVDRSRFRPDKAANDSSGRGPKTYWTLAGARAAGAAHPVTSMQSIVAELDELLSDIVRNQLISDVPVGTFLSGGIDSSLVTAVAQAVSSQRIRTFSVGFENKDYDESGFASTIAAHLGTDHTELFVGDAAAKDAIPLLPGIYSEPFADPSQIPTYLISSLARQHVKVVLSGDGGDELFGGYNRYLYPARVLDKMRLLPDPVRRLVGATLRSMRPDRIDKLYAGLKRLPGIAGGHTRAGLKLQKLGEVMQASNEFEMYEHLISYWPDAEVPLQTPVSHENLLPARFSQLAEDDAWSAALQYDQAVYLPDNNLVKVDRASMAVSLETRLPLLDHRLVELAWRVPQSLNLINGAGKQPLRQVLARYVPPGMFERPKMGFSVPIADWIRGPLREWTCDLLSPEALRRRGLLDAESIKNTLDSHLAGKRDNALKLWSVLMLQAWSDQND